MEELLTLKEAAGFLNVSEKTIRRKIRGGQLLGNMREGKYLVSKACLEVVKNEVSRGGQVDSPIQAQMTLELRSLRQKLEGLTEENKRLSYEIKQSREEARQLTAVVYDLSSKLIKLLPPPEEERKAEQKKTKGFWSRLSASLFGEPLPTN